MKPNNLPTNLKDNDLLLIAMYCIGNENSTEFKSINKQAVKELGMMFFTDIYEKINSSKIINNSDFISHKVNCSEKTNEPEKPNTLEVVVENIEGGRKLSELEKGFTMDSSDGVFGERKILTMLELEKEALIISEKVENFISVLSVSEKHELCQGIENDFKKQTRGNGEVVFDYSKGQYTYTRLLSIVAELYKYSQRCTPENPVAFPMADFEFRRQYLMWGKEYVGKEANSKEYVLIMLKK